MDDVNQAVDFVLDQEDAGLTGNITTLPGDTGGATRFGLASADHPELVKEGYYEETDGQPKIPKEEALDIAEVKYAEEYGDKIDLSEIADQGVADRVLSFAVNEGEHEAIVILQRALNFLGASLATDGIMGPITLAALNAQNPDSVLATMRSMQADFYRHLVAVKPQLLPYLNGFLNRVNA